MNQIKYSSDNNYSTDNSRSNGNLSTCSPVHMSTNQMNQNNQKNHSSDRSGSNGNLSTRPPVDLSTNTKSRRDDTFITACFSLRREGNTFITACFSLRRTGRHLINFVLSCMRKNHEPHEPHEQDTFKSKFVRLVKFVVNNGNSSTSLFRPFAFLLLFLSMVTFLRAQQIAPVANNGQVVIMGDSIAFSVNLLSPSTPYSGHLKITVPAGFKLLPHGMIADSMSSDGLSGRMTANLVQGSTLPLTFYVQPLCNAATAVTDVNRVITYDFYAPSSAATPLISASTDPVTLFNNPILNVTYPAAINDAILNQEYTRVVSIRQTAPSSHVNNLQITVNCDKTAFEIKKIRVSSDSLTWTDITASALNTAQAGKYVYKITRANTFDPLSYGGKKLQVGDVVYIQETVVLKKCSGGTTNYSIAYGDGNTFCSPASTAQVNINSLDPAYSVDYRYSVYQSNINYNNAGTFRTHISNNGVNPEAWMLKTFVSIFDTKYSDAPYHRLPGDTLPPHRFDSVALLKSDGKTVLCMIPISNNINMESKSFANPSVNFNLSENKYIHKIDFEKLPKATTQAEMDAYINAGLSDMDGDSIYSDIRPGDTVNINIYYHFYIENGIVNCNSHRLFESYLKSDVFWNDRCEQTWSFSHVVNANYGTYYFAIRGGINAPVATIKNDYLLGIGDTDTLTVMMQTGNASSGQRGYPYEDITNTRKHMVVITFPNGLDYDGTVANPVKIRNQTSPTTKDAEDINWNLATRTLTFRNTKSLVQPIYYDIPVIANSNTDINKSLRIEHTFEEDGMGTGIHTWSCRNTTVPYIQKLQCDSLEMVEFTAERTSFGWIDTSSTSPNRPDTTGLSRANRNTPGIDLHAFGPYDNITFTNKIAVNNTISQINPGDSVMIELSYSVPYQGALFDTLVADPSRKIVLSYKKTGSLSFDSITEFSPTNNSALIRRINTNPKHSIGINIASFIGSNPTQIALNAGDSLKVEYFLQTTANIQRTYPLLVQVQAEVYTRRGANPRQSCYPRQQTIKTFNYNLGNPTSVSTQPISVNLTHGNGNFLRWQLDNGTGSVEDVFPNEYRPSVFIKEMTFTIDALLKINELWWGYQNSTSKYLPMAAGDYTVSYRNDSTIITINKYPLMRESFENYSSGWYVWASYDIICVSPNKTSITSSSNFQRLDYPTSAGPKNYRTQTGNSSTYRWGDLTPNLHYQTSVTSPATLKTTTTSEISWDFNINNESAFANTDPYLPNSWVAFECDAGIIPFELYDNDNNTVVANISSSNSYGTGNNKWWVVLDSLRVPTTRSYTIRCHYTACEGQPGMNIIHGFSRLVLPTNPQAGFPYPYNASVCHTKSVRVSMTPPAIDFSGIVTHRPEYGNGTNDFCDTTGFLVTYQNGLPTEVFNLKLKIALPVGFDYDTVQPATVKFGTGLWKSPASVKQTGRNLEIILSTTDSLAASDNAGASAYVDFRLKISCGAENKQQIYAEFIGESTCGRAVSKIYNSNQIKIAGLATMPPYWIMSLSSPPTPVYTSSTAPNNGSFTILGQYMRGNNAGGDDLQAIIEIPDNLNLTTQDSSAGNLIFSKIGNRLVGVLPATDAFGAVRDFNLTLTPTNSHLWSEDSVKINFYTGMESTKICGKDTCSVLDRSEALDSIKFAMQMLDIRYDNSITATSRYGSTTTERVEIKGWLINDCAYAAGTLAMELWYYNGTNYVKSNATSLSGLTVSGVAPNGGKTAFTVTANVPYTENVCSMLLVLRKTGSGASNGYLSDSVAIAVPVPRYDISAQPTAICQMAVNTSIGEGSITGYAYSWSPSNYLTNASATPTNFTYDYNTNPVANDTTLNYIVTITRPKGCPVKDTIFVPLKGIPFVDANDTAICNNSPLRIIFTDRTNSNPTTNPTTFNWEVLSSGWISGFTPKSGVDSIKMTKLSNATTFPGSVALSITPMKNGCSGVSDEFTVIVYAELTPGKINPNTPLSYCAGILPAIYVGGNTATGGSGNYTYQWQSCTDNQSFTSAGVSDMMFSLGGASLSQTTYYLRQVTDAFCGTKHSDTMQITIKPLPTVSTVTTVVCPGITSILTPATNSSGTWATNNSAIAELFDSNIVRGKSAGTAILTYTSLVTGCIKDLTITVNNYPVVSEITGRGAVCIDSSVQLSSATSGGVWTSNNPNVTFTPASTSNPVTATVSAANTDRKTFITYTVSSGVCQTKRTFPLKVVPVSKSKIIIGIER